MEKASEASARLGQVVTARVPVLDGVRAVAILIVFLCHAGLRDAIGAVGVDVFFVLSGYLITSILVAERLRSGGIDVLAFYRRRILRLTPALVVMLAAFSAFFMLSPWRHGIPSQPLWAFSYLSNWARSLGGVAMGPVGQTWSLAVEGQYYLLWPLLLVGLFARRVRLARSARLVALFAVASLCWSYRVLVSGGSYARVYFGTDTHAYGLLFGSALALLLAARPPTAVRLRRAVGVPALLTVLCAGFIYSSPTTQLSLVEPVAALAAAALIWSLTGQVPPALRALLGNRVASYLGRISYSLYLWHLPVIWVLERLPWFEMHPLVKWAAMIGVPFACAAASYRFVELPVLARRPVARGFARGKEVAAQAT